MAKDSSPANSGPWKEFLAAFVTIFLAEFADKTQIAIVLMAAESHAPWVVFTGAAFALIMTSVLGIALGRWLAGRLSAQALQTMTGASLLSISLWLLWDLGHL
ncbi:TMEM165/GDT1 family protein [Candidatus Synechococcus calcipolaris G9]|uniref:GDT1 family protein n=1 Tax=Candidatus Synechococcus calcipolaris G9 TaxID=1497997 RepID=A0ABT6F0Y1_9SYNE|nr:TMEM165/GDT1 family protein [Candidatus Synechococcus calcipolaris]MDG2991487.1 TMEM165/GDT1 family protein [Candidatus Synechococcus calcipolaris G9]